MTVATELPTLLTEDELAKKLGIPKTSLQQDRFYRKGLPYLKIGKKIRYDAAVVADYLESCRVPAGSAPPAVSPIEPRRHRPARPRD